MSIYSVLIFPSVAGMFAAMTTSSSISNPQGAFDEEVPVLVIGGGGAGLTASMLLSGLGVDHLLVSALPETSILPKAHVLNMRTMEILEDAGVAGAIEVRSTPPQQMAATAFYAGFAGGEGYGRTLAKLECWGAGGADENWLAVSPWHQLNLPQIRLEPVMKAHADRLAPGRIRFNHELIELDQDADGVNALVRDGASGEVYRVRCDYLIGADGGRTLPGLLGIGYEGLGVVSQTATIHATADLSRWAGDDDVLLRWVISPQYGAGVVLVPMGPERWGPDSEEWVIHVFYPVDADPQELSDERVMADAHTAMGVADLEMEVHNIRRWKVEAVMAESFRSGRVFLVGDAAHRHPPTGGLGLTSGIQDAHNLCWKLAAVIGGDAAPPLLDSYEPERRSSVARNAQRSLENAVNHLMIAQTLEVSPENSEEQNWANMSRVWSDDPADAEVRAAVRRLMRASSMEFNELNVEYGYTYESSAIVPDGTPAPQSADDVRVYEPSTRPGSPLPHAWLEDDAGNRVPIKHLVPPGRFLLIAGEEGEAWCEAARSLADAHHLPLDAVRIGHLDGDWYDPRCTWLRHRVIGPDGALLVRPDRFVAWRNTGSSQDPASELARALAQILARPIGVPAPAAN